MYSATIRGSNQARNKFRWAFPFSISFLKIAGYCREWQHDGMIKWAGGTHTHTQTHLFYTQGPSVPSNLRRSLNWSFNGVTFRGVTQWKKLLQGVSFGDSIWSCVMLCVCVCVSACIHAWVFALCCIHKFVLDLAQILQNEQSRRLRRRHCCVKDCASWAALVTSRLHCGKAHSFELLP